MRKTALIVTDFCPGCLDPTKHEASMHLIDLPLDIKGKKYTKICVPLCDGCSEAKEASRLKANLLYALSEGYLF